MHDFLMLASNAQSSFSGGTYQNLGNFPNGNGAITSNSRFLENASTLNPNERSRCANERLWQSLWKRKSHSYFLQHNVEFCFPTSKSNQKQARQLIASAGCAALMGQISCFRVISSLNQPKRSQILVKAFDEWNDITGESATPVMSSKLLLMLLLPLFVTPDASQPGAG